MLRIPLNKIYYQLKALSGDTARVAQAWLNKLGGFRVYAFVLLVAMTAAYNAQIWKMGYYYDDWEGVFLQKQLFSARQVWEYFLIDRPFSSAIHLFYNPFLGAGPVGWRIAGQLLNWAAILLLVKMLLEIWPKRVMEIGWIGLLLALYPGITRQFVIRTSMVHYTSMLLFALSLLLMVKAVTGSRHSRLYTAISIGLGLLQVLLIEYFSGLEFIRLLLLFYLVLKSGLSIKQSIRKAFLLWLPYAAVFLGFLIFRLGVLPLIQMEGMVAKNQPQIFSQLLKNPVGMILQYTEIILQDAVYATVYVWSQAIVPEEIDLQAAATLASWLLGILVAAFCAVVVLAWHRKTVAEEVRERFPVLVVVLCLAAVLLGGLPIWVIGRQAIKGIWASRYLFGVVLGAVPLVVIFVTWLAGQPRRHMQSIIFALLLAGSFSMQFRLANKYALNWYYQRDYYWQIKWRAPSLAPNTFILAPATPFSLNADYQIAYAINILYAPGNNQAQTRYWWFDGPDDVIDYESRVYPTEKVINYTFRSLSFQSDMQHALPVMYRPARGCLQVIDRVYQEEPGLLPEEQQLFPVANPGVINEQHISVPEDVFGREPARGWCYHFQKADLARQQKRWEAVIHLWEQAEAQGLAPSYGPEYLPFIEASMLTGNWDQAVDFTSAADALTEKMPPFLCAAWSRITKEAPDSSEKQTSWDAVKNTYGCGNPQ